jgi:hypothetical protein
MAPNQPTAADGLKSMAAVASSRKPSPTPKWMIGSPPPPVISAAAIAAGSEATIRMLPMRPRGDRMK